MQTHKLRDLYGDRNVAGSAERSIDILAERLVTNSNTAQLVTSYILIDPGY